VPPMPVTFQVRSTVTSLIGIMQLNTWSSSSILTGIALTSAQSEISAPVA